MSSIRLYHIIPYQIISHRRRGRKETRRIVFQTTVEALTSAQTAATN